jgi:hypothetical protein
MVNKQDFSLPYVKETQIAFAVQKKAFIEVAGHVKQGVETTVRLYIGPITFNMIFFWFTFIRLRVSYDEICMTLSKGWSSRIYIHQLKAITCRKSNKPNMPNCFLFDNLLLELGPLAFGVRIAYMITTICNPLNASQF